MRKQAANNFTAVNAGQRQFKESRKTQSVKKNPRYIYTEEDLGEGILDVGINLPHKTGRQGQNLQFWN
jgi:hypothetical protein